MPSKPHIIALKFVLMAFLFLAPIKCPAVLLDWNPQSWTGGSLSRSFDLDATNPGNDVTITITGNTSYAQGGTPNDTTDLTGGQGGSQQSLFMHMDWNNRNRSITVTIEFLYDLGVDNLSFTLFDVDRISGNHTDKIFDILGTTDGGGAVAATVTTSSANQLVGTGTSQYVRGTSGADSDTSDGNVGITFGSTPIYSAQFSWGSETNAPSNPGDQWIGLYDISFTKRVIPEVHPGLASSLACFLVIGFRCLTSRLRRTQKTAGPNCP